MDPIQAAWATIALALMIGDETVDQEKAKSGWRWGSEIEYRIRLGEGRRLDIRAPHDGRGHPGLRLVFRF